MAVQFIGTLLTLLYPVIVYLTWGKMPSWIFVAIIALALTIRIVLLHPNLQGKQKLAIGMAIAGIACVLSLALPEITALAYPTAVNFGLAAVFAISLIYPPTMIERIARRMEPNLDAHGVHYTRRVTQVWLIFFLCNGSLSCGLAVYAPLNIWALYTGGISYLLIGLVFAIEYLVRRHVRRKHIEQT